VCQKKKEKKKGIYNGEIIISCIRFEVGTDRMKVLVYEEWECTDIKDSPQK
jgi:hypothetical protein